MFGKNESEKGKKKRIKKINTKKVGVGLELYCGALDSVVYDVNNMDNMRFR